MDFAKHLQIYSFGSDKSLYIWVAKELVISLSDNPDRDIIDIGA